MAKALGSLLGESLVKSNRIESANGIDESPFYIYNNNRMIYNDSNDLSARLIIAFYAQESQ